MKVCFVIPIFNDWVSLERLLRGIDESMLVSGASARVLVVDDGSTLSDDDAGWAFRSYKAIEQVEILRLACNLGHQKAIAIGLSVAAGFEDCGYVVIMDGDGEDDPADLPRFLATMRDSKAPIVLAHRAKRSEGLLFRAFYIVYKLLFRQLTGQSLSFGNYCAMTNASARRLAFMPILWNSLPATCLRSKLPYTTIPVVRGRRYAGEAKMRFVDLILHGMQAITTFSDTVLVRLSLAAVLAVLAAIFAVVMVRFWEPGWIVPGWASNMVGFLVLSLVTILFGLLSTSLLALQERCNMPLIPFLHSEHYIRDVRKVWPCQ